MSSLAVTLLFRRILAALWLWSSCSQAFVTTQTAPTNIKNKNTDVVVALDVQSSNAVPLCWPLHMNVFYDDFEDFSSGDDDEETLMEDALKREKDLRDKELRDKAANVTSVEEFVKLISNADKEEEQGPKEWAKETDGKLKPGVVLVANPEKFDLPSPIDVGGADRLADALPVLIVTKHGGGLLGGSTEALVWNKRSGALVGDIERQFNEARKKQQESGEAASSTKSNLPPPQLGAFMIQPVWNGGNNAVDKGDDLPFDMLHLCPAVDGAIKLTDDGVYIGGNPEQAQKIMAEPSLNGVGRPLSSSDFRFYVQSTRWMPLQLEGQIETEQWFTAHVSKDILFKPRDSIGALRVKPLWTEIMEKLGTSNSKFQKIRDEFYSRE